MFLSFVLNAAPGATVVLTQAAVFGLVLAATWGRGPAMASRSSEPRHEPSHAHDGRYHFHAHAHLGVESSHRHPH